MGMLLAVQGVVVALTFAVVVGVGVRLLTKADTMPPEPPSVPLSPHTGADKPLVVTATPASTPPPCTAVGETWTRPADGMEMVCVPAGEFLMGSTGDDLGANDDEKPRHNVYLDAFWIDKHEVSNAQHRKCVKAGACYEPVYRDDGGYKAPDQAVVYVNYWGDARSYASWVGGRLPTEAEWEKAARGTDRRIYPWGDSPPECGKAYYGGCAGRPLAVGSHPGGASPYGALDMSGNVEEWVADWYEEAYYSESPARNSLGPDSGQMRVTRGGRFLSDQRLVRCTVRGAFGRYGRSRYIGFRVVMNPGPSGP